jgi:hypothetical protein
MKIRWTTEGVLGAFNGIDPQPPSRFGIARGDVIDIDDTEGQRYVTLGRAVAIDQQKEGH